MKNAVIDPGLRQYATVRQLEYLEAIENYGGIRPAARELKMSMNAVHSSLESLKRRAALAGYAPAYDMVHPVPEPFVTKGVSTYYDAEGKPRGQWVKSRLTEDAYAAYVKEAVAAFVEDVPKIKAPAGPRKYDKDVIPWIQIGDAHIGMLAHAAEVGESFDLKIAERELCGAIGILIDEMPITERLVINDLGDATHYDNFSATTAASGHALDFDSRFPKMLRVYSRVMRFVVEKALTKAKHVDVIVNQGNHSRINDFWMREMLEVAYGHTGRVHVLNNDSVFIGYRMGKTFVMTHHSDKCRPEKLVGVLTTDFRKDFGETDYHYIDTGHVHHHFVSKEHPSVIIESWNHLAATDKWAHDAGYRSRKSISVVLRSRTYGEIGRRLLPIQEVRDRLAGSKIIVPRKEAYAV